MILEKLEYAVIAGVRTNNMIALLVMCRLQKRDMRCSGVSPGQSAAFNAASNWVTSSGLTS
jgi:hypothetical protein